MADDLGPWAPLSVDEATAVLAGCPVPWWIAGGWAIARTDPGHDWLAALDTGGRATTS